jgi:hypothetical protein
MDEVVFALPVVVALAPVIVAASRRRWLGVVGFGMFTWGWVSLVFFVGAENSGNNPLHMLWLAGLILLELGMVPEARPESWWYQRYGKDGGRFVVSPLLIVVALGVFLATNGGSWLYPILLVTALLVAVVFVALVTVVLRRNRTAEGLALMGAVSLAPVVAVGFAYNSGAFFFGF